MAKTGRGGDSHVTGYIDKMEQMDRGAVEETTSLEVGKAYAR
jgi:hypothetical protein